MIPRTDDDGPVLGSPPEPPEQVWRQALAHALDPWSVPTGGLVPAGDDPGGDGRFADDGTERAAGVDAHEDPRAQDAGGLAPHDRLSPDDPGDPDPDAPSWSADGDGHL